MKLVSKLKSNELQIKIFLFFCLAAIIVSAIQYKNILVILIQIAFYYFVAEEIHCKIHGGCIFSSWITTIIPIIGIVIFILDYFKLFETLKSKLQFVYKKTDKILPDNKININIDKNNIPI